MSWKHTSHITFQRIHRLVWTYIHSIAYTCTFNCIHMYIHANMHTYLRMHSIARMICPFGWYDTIHAFMIDLSFLLWWLACFVCLFVCCVVKDVRDPIIVQDRLQAYYINTVQFMLRWAQVNLLPTRNNSTDWRHDPKDSSLAYETLLKYTHKAAKW